MHTSALALVVKLKLAMPFQRLISKLIAEPLLCTLSPLARLPGIKVEIDALLATLPT